MKKVKLLLVSFFAILAISCMQETKAQSVVFPFGPSSTVISSADSLTLDLGTIYNTNTMVTIDSSTLDAPLTVSIGTLNSVRTGSVLTVKARASSGDEIITWGTNMTGLNDTITATKQVVIPFIYDGTGFIKSGTAVQID